MKRYILTIIAAVLCFTACNKEKLNDETVFQDRGDLMTDFDIWLYQNYVEPYNIQFNHRYVDRESDNQYNLIPAEKSKAIAMAKLIKHLWIGAYDELVGPDFMKTYCPRMIQLIGSKAYNSQGSVVVGTAEGGMKITLYNVNAINVNSPSISFLNEWFFGTMHHEFAHILHQTKNYSTDFNLISKDYQGPSWVNLEEKDAHQMGFVTAYASSSTDEDFVEIIAKYVTNQAGYWESLLESSGEEGKAKMEKKMEIVKSYLLQSWGIDLDRLRDIVQRRSAELSTLNLIDLN